jgi:hypothetical protein
VRKQLRRREVLGFFANLPRCLIGMEACGGAHYWAQRLMEYGHTVKLMAPQFVRPYVKTNKTDARDAEAICEAVTRPTMRFVPVKTPEQQAILALHRARQGFVKARTAQANQLRSLLAEFGLVLPQGIQHLRRQLPAALAELETKVPEIVRQLFLTLFAHVGDRLHQWTPVGRLARLSPAPTLQWREASVTGHQEAGQYLSADLIDSWGPGRTAPRARAERASQELAAASPSPAQHQRGDCRPGQQECAYRLGLTRPSAGL